MTSVFTHSSCVDFLKEHLSSLPNRGHGEMRKWAEVLGISPTLMTQVMAGSRNLSPDHAYDFKNYFGWSDLETEYFLLLIQIERSQKAKFKKYLEIKRDELRKTSSKISNRVVYQREMKDEEKSIFYSSWLYSAVRLYCSTGKTGRTLLEISQEFDLSISKTETITQFLVEVGLCKLENSHYAMGEKSTHIKDNSAHVAKHHTNWRLKAIQNVETLSEEELAFSGPFSISENDFQILREKLLQLVKETYELVGPSPAERVGCLNLDLFYVSKKIPAK